MLYVGRVHESKGIDKVIRAIKDLRIKFLVVGKDVGYRETLEKLAKEESMENKVKFLGAVSDSELEEIYSLCDFFILFSSWEGFGIVVIEAMNNGKPVIVSNRGSLPLIVKDNETGFIVDYPNVNKLKEKIEKMIDDDKKRRKMGKAAKKFSKKFGWENLAKEYLKIYNKTIERYRKS